MRTNKIKEFYEAAVKEGKFSSKFFKGIEEISTEEELRNFIEEKVQPVAKEMGYNFSTDELVIYEKQMAKKITEQQLENISGGVDVKNLALGGIVSLMALGAGVAGATSTTSAMNPRTQNAQKTEPANVPSLQTQEEQSSTAQVSGSQIEQNENNTLTISDSKINSKIEYKNEVNKKIKEIEEDFRAQKEKLKLNNDYDEDFNKLIKDEKSKINDDINAIDDSNKSDIESKIEEFKNRLNKRFVEEVKSKINVDKLKGAHKRARDRGDDPRKNNKKPKLAQFLERDAGINLSHDKMSKQLKTPFGKTFVKFSKTENSENINRMVYVHLAPSYVDISYYLDEYCQKNGKESTLKMLHAIDDYLKIDAKDDDTVEKIWDSVKFDNKSNKRISYKKSEKIMPKATQYERTHAAALCGILMVCESGEYRSENGGKRERGVIRTLIKMVEQGTSEHPFGDAFGRYDEEGRYKEGFYTPSSVGGTARAQKVLDKNTKKFIPPQVIERDKKDTGYLELSSDSEETPKMTIN